MISTNALSIYILQQDQNNIFEQNLRSIQDAIHLDEPSGSKLKWVCTELPNLAVLTKSATPGDTQVTYAHASVGKNPFGETVTAFALAGSIKASTVV